MVKIRCHGSIASTKLFVNTSLILLHIHAFKTNIKVVFIYIYISKTKLFYPFFDGLDVWYDILHEYTRVLVLLCIRFLDPGRADGTSGDILEYYLENIQEMSILHVFLQYGTAVVMIGEL